MGGDCRPVRCNTTTEEIVGSCLGQNFPSFFWSALSRIFHRKRTGYGKKRRRTSGENYLGCSVVMRLVRFRK